jgi:hypothetical protein
VNRTTSAWGGAPQSGSRCAGTQPYSSPSHHLFQSGPFTCSSGTTYNFSYYLSGQTEGFWDGLIVGYSFNGSTWYYRGSYTIGYMWYTNAHNGYLANPWGLQSFNFTATGNQIWIRIGFTADWSIQYTGATIDNMKIM